MNLALIRREYRRVMVECEESLAGGHPTEQCRAAAVAQIEATRRAAMILINQYASRRSLSVDTRTGFVAKLDQLHQATLTQLSALIGR